MTARPSVSVWRNGEIKDSISMPQVFSAPIRDDIVQFVHSNMAKNRRQAHGVFWQQGHQHSAESWGTGRAVARIPRIGGSGTHRSGQAAFGNMCRKGRMFAPLRTWRKWHRKINVNQKRHAVASALAASAVGPLVQARGHRCDNVPELPLVINWNSSAEDKTSDLLATLNAHGVGDDLHRVRSTRNNRAGNGKMRGSRFVLRKGPLIVHDNNDSIKRVARNLPGVDTCNVHRLNLLQLAPGGHLGRLVVFTQDAFAALNSVFGDGRNPSTEKSGYTLQRNFMACADLARIINSDQVQSKLREVRTSVRAHDKTKRNPLKNRTMMNRLNPAAAALAKVKAAASVRRSAKENRKLRAVRSGRFAQVQQELEDSFQAAHQVILDEIKAGQYDQEDSAEEEDDE